MAALDYAKELGGATCTPLQSGPHNGGSGGHTEWDTTMGAAAAEAHPTTKTAALKA